MRWNSRRRNPRTRTYRLLSKPDTSHLKRSGRYIPPSRRTWKDKLISILKSPVVRLERRILEPFANFLDNADLFRILEKLGFLIAVVVFLFDISTRRENSIYQAWQVVKDGQGEKSGVVVLALERLKKQNFSLSGIKVQDTNLDGVDLEGANLKEANLADASLWGANLMFADLLRANLKGANLKAANLMFADLLRANLKGANLEYANLEGAYLEEVNLKGANLEYANLEGANLEGACFKLATNLKPEQVKEALNWKQAYYDSTLRTQLGLPAPDKEDEKFFCP